MEEAGPERTDNSSLVNIVSVEYVASCETHPTDVWSGGCLLNVSSEVGSESSCTHEQDMWLSCGYAGNLGDGACRENCS